MKKKEIAASNGVLNIARKTLLDLPVAALKRLVVGGSDRELYEAAWSAYDSVVGFTSETTERVYSNQGIGQVIGQSMDMMLRVQRFNYAVAGAFFSALWPAVGLPTANELEATRHDIRELREELRTAVAARELEARAPEAVVNAPRESVFDAYVPAIERPAKSVYQVSVWSGWTSPPMEANGNVRN